LLPVVALQCDDLKPFVNPRHGNLRLQLVFGKPE
jgi:hypothetical protein